MDIFKGNCRINNLNMHNMRRWFNKQKVILSYFVFYTHFLEETTTGKT